MVSAAVRSNVVILLLVADPISNCVCVCVWGGVWSSFCGVVLSVLISLAFCNHLVDEGRAGCFPFMVFLSCVSFLAVPWAGLWFVIVAFLGHNHYSLVVLFLLAHFMPMTLFMKSMCLLYWSTGCIRHSFSIEGFFYVYAMS